MMGKWIESCLALCNRTPEMRCAAHLVPRVVRIGPTCDWQDLGRMARRSLQECLASQSESGRTPFSSCR